MSHTGRSANDSNPHHGCKAVEIGAHYKRGLLKEFAGASLAVLDNNITISCLVSYQDYSNLSNCRCIEAPPIITHSYPIRIDYNIENRRGGVLEGILETASKMIAIMQHVLERSDDVSSCSRIDLLSVCCLQF